MRLSNDMDLKCNRREKVHTDRLTDILMGFGFLPRWRRRHLCWVRRLGVWVLRSMLGRPSLRLESTWCLADPGWKEISCTCVNIAQDYIRGMMFYISGDTKWCFFVGGIISHIVVNRNISKASKLVKNMKKWFQFLKAFIGSWSEYFCSVKMYIINKTGAIHHQSD